MNWDELEEVFADIMQGLDPEGPCTCGSDPDGHCRPCGQSMRGQDRLRRLGADLERLRPSGQVMEDVRTLQACVEQAASAMGRDALSRLAAPAKETDGFKAQLEEREVMLAGHRERETTYQRALEGLRAKVAEVEALRAQDQALEAKQREQGDVARRERDAARTEVDRKQRLLNSTISQREELKGEAIALKAEVERLKTEVARVTLAYDRQCTIALHQAELRKEADSRLAAIRVALERARNVLHHGGSCADGLDALNKVLEGDAPQEAKSPAVQLVELAVEAGLPVRFVPRSRHPCSDSCTHDDARTPGHPERVKGMSAAFRRAMAVDATVHEVVKERSEAVKEAIACDHGIPIDDDCDACLNARVREDVETALAEIEETEAYERGAEAMRAACWELVQDELRLHGWGPGDGPWTRLKAAIEGAAP